jgi:hypothetical protein
VIIESKYDVGQRVEIIAINQDARIIEIGLCGKNLYYTLDYWCNCEIKTVKQSEDEIR